MSKLEINGKSFSYSVERVNVRRWAPSPLNPRQGKELNNDKLKGMQTWNPQPGKPIRLMRQDDKYIILSGHCRHAYLSEAKNYLDIIDSSFDGGKRPDTLAVNDLRYGPEVHVFDSMSELDQMLVIGFDNDDSQKAWSSVQCVRFMAEYIRRSGANPSEAARLLGVATGKGSQYVQYKAIVTLPEFALRAWIDSQDENSPKKMSTTTAREMAEARAAFRKGKAGLSPDSHGPTFDKLWADWLAEVEAAKTGATIQKAVMLSAKSIQEFADRAYTCNGAHEIARVLYAALGYDHCARTDGKAAVCDGAAILSTILSQYPGFSPDELREYSASLIVVAAPEASIAPEASTATQPQRNRNRNRNGSVVANA